MAPLVIDVSPTVLSDEPPQPAKDNVIKDANTFN
jgi:hypothetical protein